MSRPDITGFGHIDLTVTDLEESSRWWEEVMGFKLVHTTNKPGITVWSHMRRGVAISLVLHEDLSATKFDERAVGLDHFALQVQDRAELQSWAEHFDALGVAHSGIREEKGGPLIVLRDPDNIQLEVWAYNPEELGELVVNR